MAGREDMSYLSMGSGGVIMLAWREEAGKEGSGIGP